MAIWFALIAAACVSDSGVPAAERRAQRLEKTIMCPVCPGESIDQSQNALSLQMRGIVEEKIEQGWSDSAIRSFFVERYGPSVLLEPPRSGFNLTAWILPPVGVGGALLALYFVLRNMRRPRGSRREEIIEAIELTEEDVSRYFPLVDAASGGPEAPATGPAADDGSESHREGTG